MVLLLLLLLCSFPDVFANRRLQNDKSVLPAFANIVVVAAAAVAAAAVGVVFVVIGRGVSYLLFLWANANVVLNHPAEAL